MRCPYCESRKVATRQVRQRNLYVCLKTDCMRQFTDKDLKVKVAAKPRVRREVVREPVKEKFHGIPAGRVMYRQLAGWGGWR